MKNSYRVVLIGLAVLGVVYASTGPENMKKDVKHEAIEKSPRTLPPWSSSLVLCLWKWVILYSSRSVTKVRSN